MTRWGSYDHDLAMQAHVEREAERMAALTMLMAAERQTSLRRSRDWRLREATARRDVPPPEMVAKLLGGVS